MNCIIDLGHSGHHIEWVSYFINSEIHVYTSMMNKSILEKYSPTNVTYVKENINEEEFLREYKEELEQYTSIIFLNLDLVFSYLLRSAINPLPFNLVQKKIKGLWLRNNFYYNRFTLIGRIKFWIMILIIAIWKQRSKRFSIYFLNEQVTNSIQSYLGSDAVRFSVDPVDLDKLDQEPETEPGTILLFGSHDPRKGTDVALAELAKIRYPGKVIIGGSITNMPKLKQQLTQLDEELDIEKFLGYVSEKVMHRIFKRSEIILLPYVGFGGSSGVLSWGIAYNKTVIGSNFGLIGKRLREYEKGFTFDKINDLSISLAQHNTISSGRLNSIEMISKYHSKAEFIKQFLYEDK